MEDCLKETFQIMGYANGGCHTGRMVIVDIYDRPQSISSQPYNNPWSSRANQPHT